MSTPNDLITRANKLIDDTIDNASWINWFNSALDDLSESMFLETKATLTNQDTDGGFILPDNFREPILVQYDQYNQFDPIDVRNMVDTGYKIYDGKLYIQGQVVASVELYYYRTPTYISTSAVDTTLDVPEKYVEAIILYGCMRAMEYEDEPTIYRQYQADYSNSKARITRESAKVKPLRTGSWQVIR